MDSSFLIRVPREFVHPIFFVFSAYEQCFTDFAPDNKTKKRFNLRGTGVIDHSGPVQLGSTSRLIFFLNISSNSAVTVLALDNDKIIHKVGGLKR